MNHKNSLSPIVRDGAVIILHNGNPVPFCSEYPTYTIDDIDCGMVNLFSSLAYWSDWDYMQLYVELSIPNPLARCEIEIVSSLTKIPLKEIDTLQTIYDNKIELCKSVINEMVVGFNEMLCKMSKGK